MSTFKLTLKLYGVFFFALEHDKKGKVVKKVWVLGADGRSGRVASDGKTYLPAHWSVLSVPAQNLAETLDDMILLPKKHALWPFDAHQLEFDFKPAGARAPLSGDFEPRPGDPPDDKNKDQFRWMSLMKTAAPKARLKKNLFDKKEVRGLSSRMVFDFGHFTSAELGQAEKGQFLSFSYEVLNQTKNHSPFGALSNGVSVLLGEFSEVDLIRRPILGAKDKKQRPTKVAKLVGGGAKSVEIILFNSPIEHILMDPGASHDMAIRNTGPYIAHFERHYDLVQPRPKTLLVPFSLGLTPSGPTNHNISCPPTLTVRN